MYHAAPDLALYFILPKLNVDTSMVIEKKKKDFYL
jgi:hypothetical protein